MAGLVEQLETKREHDREQAVTAYRQILARSASPQDGDAAALADAMNVLGLSGADVADDLGALAQAEKHRVEIERLEAQAAGVRKELATLPSQASLKAEQQRIQAIRIQRADLEDAGGRLAGGQASAAQELSRVRRAHPRIWDQELGP